jgi:hypothetical protein
LSGNNPDPLLDGVEKMLTGLIKEAMENERTVADDKGVLVKVPAVSFEDRLKLVATCTKFLESKVKITPPPPEMPGAFEELLNAQNGETVSGGSAGAPRKRRGRPPRSKLPEAQFDPENGRDGGKTHFASDRAAINGHATLTTTPFWGNGDDNDGDAANA